MFFKLFDYIIEYGDELRWRCGFGEGELTMSGGCTLDEKLSLLILHGYEDMSAEDMPEAETLWSKSDYYMTVSETGNTNIYNVSDGESVSDEVKQKIGIGVGCTMRFR